MNALVSATIIPDYVEGKPGGKMYLGIDVGATKTLLAVFTKNGEIKQSVKLKTPHNYSQFLDVLTEGIHSLDEKDFAAIGLAIPGVVDRENGVGIAFGNLPWKNVHLVSYLEKLTNTPVLIENDSKLAALSEAILIKDDYRKVLYVTISTGISAGLIVDGVIDPELADSESGHMLLEHKGHLTKWQDFASGKAIFKRYGKLASEITDQAEWKVIAHDIALGLIDLIAVLQPDVIILGGGVGANFSKFKVPLMKQLKKYEMPLVPIPPVRMAKRPEEAVIYGCYELLKAHYG